MPRTILVHLNVQVAESDTRTADEIADKIMEGAYAEMIKDAPKWKTIQIEAPLAEDV